MARKKKKTMWVIFARPQQFGRPGNRYFALDGTVTKIPKLAAKFFTLGDAQEFVKAKRIELSAIRYIGQDDFQESDI